jgi:hypothetical protein
MYDSFLLIPLQRQSKYSERIISPAKNNFSRTGESIEKNSGEVPKCAVARESETKMSASELTHTIKFRTVWFDIKAKSSAGARGNRRRKEIWFIKKPL